MSAGLQELSKLEWRIAKLKGAAAMVTVMREEVLDPLKPDMAKELGVSAAFMGAFRVYALTDHHDDALHHALIHIEALVDDLQTSFCAALHAASEAESKEGAKP